MIIHTYFLCNREKEPERYNSIIKQIKELEIKNYSFFSYIWGNEITAELRMKWVKSDTSMRYHNRDMITKPLSNGEISLFINHIECLKQIKDNYKSGYFLICESDVIFKDNFNNNLNTIFNLINQKDDIDIINIGSGNGNDLPKSEPIKSELALYKEKINRCTEGIIWTYNGVCKFLEYFEKTLDIDSPIDTKMDVFSEHIGGFNIYWVHPSLVYQGSVVGIFKSILR
jgi:GR25 family glycosyltransferase involved in LPS biosynthesis